jgi:hypothetical protein
VDVLQVGADRRASLILEEAAREWLDRHQDGKK